MIPVVLDPEPATFDAKVRQKGADAMLELVGKAPAAPRGGPKRKAVAKRRDQIPSDAFPPYWRDVLPEMRKAYQGHCAYLAMYIEPSLDAKQRAHEQTRAPRLSHRPVTTCKQRPPTDEKSHMSGTILQPGHDNPEDTIRNDVVRRLAHGQPAAVYRVCPDVFQQIALRLNETITKRQHPLHPDGPAIACLELYSNGQVALVFTGATSGSSASPSSDITVNELDNEERSQDEDDDLDDDDLDDDSDDDLDADDLDDDDLDDNDLLVQLAWAMMLLMVVFAGAILVVSTIQTATRKCPPQLEHR